jgi:hypothetical protein
MRVSALRRLCSTVSKGAAFSEASAERVLSTHSYSHLFCG